MNNVQSHTRLYILLGLLILLTLLYFGLRPHQLDNNNSKIPVAKEIPIEKRRVTLTSVQAKIQEESMEVSSSATPLKLSPAQAAAQKKAFEAAAKPGMQTEPNQQAENFSGLDEN